MTKSKAKAARKGRRTTRNSAAAIIAPAPAADFQGFQDKILPFYLVSPSSDLDVEVSDTDHLSDVTESTDNSYKNDDVVKESPNIQNGTEATIDKSSISTKRKKKKLKLEPQSFSDESEYSSDGIEVNIDEVPKSFKRHLAASNISLDKKNNQLQAELDALRGHIAAMQVIPSLETVLQDLISEIKSVRLEAANIRDEIKLAKTEASIMRDEVKQANNQAVTLRQELETVQKVVMDISTPTEKISKELEVANNHAVNIRQDISKTEGRIVLLADPLSCMRDEVNEARNILQDLQKAHRTVELLPTSASRTSDGTGTKSSFSRQESPNTEENPPDMPTQGTTPEIPQSEDFLSDDSSSEVTVIISDIECENSREKAVISEAQEKAVIQRNPTPISISDDSDESQDSLYTEVMRQENIPRFFQGLPQFELRPSNSQITSEAHSTLQATQIPIRNQSDHCPLGNQFCKYNSNISNTHGPHRRQSNLPDTHMSHRNQSNLPDAQAHMHALLKKQLNSPSLHSTVPGSSNVSSTKRHSSSKLAIDFNKFVGDYFDFGPRRLSRQELEEMNHKKLSILVAELCVFLFTPAELALSSVSGKRSNAHKNSIPKRPLNEDKIGGIVDYIVLLTGSSNRMYVHREILRAIKIKLGNFLKTEEAKKILNRSASPSDSIDKLVIVD